MFHAHLYGGGWTVPLLCVYLSIPFLYFKSNKLTENQFNNTRYISIDSRRDVLAAVYVVAFYCVLYSLLSNWLETLCFGIVFAILHMAALLIPLLNLMHYVIYGEMLTKGSVLVIQETRRTEVWGYMKANMSVKILSMIMVYILYGIGLSCYLVMTGGDAKDSNQLLVLLLFALSLCAVVSAFKKSSIYSMWKDMLDYKKEEEKYLINYKIRYDNLKINEEITLPSKLKGTVILVIGESASREYMHIYNDAIEYKNTPWLEDKQREKGFFVFNNVYATYNQTSEVLKMMLTESSQYNKKRFNESISIIDVAKKIGYKTYWFSNQATMGKDNAISTIIGGTADKCCKVRNDGKVGYDKEMLNMLLDVNPDENNFIIIHLEGSHAYYKSRFPTKWRKFKEETVQADYANTILYTDEVLESIYSYAKDKLNLNCMVYVSDHGENLQLGHGPMIKTADTLRIPMFIYLSDKYCNIYPDKVHCLEKNKNRFFSNDMIYNTMIGLFSANKCNCYDDKEDMSSKKYAYDVNNVLTFKGTEYAYKY